jgi:hypothetical protein
VKWERVAEVTAVKINVTHVSTEELARLQREYDGQRAPHRDLRTDNRRGLAVLFTNKQTGERRCEVYVASEGMNTKKLAETLGHELTHCVGFIH